MIKELKELWRYRELLMVMVRRELQIRYKNSVLGFLWSLVNPVITVIVMTFVFKYIMAIDVPNYSAYILAAQIPFAFFNMSLMDSSNAILSSMNIIKKIYFPREIMPLAFVISNFIHMLLALAVFFVYLLVIFLLDPRVSPFQGSVVWLPLLLVVHLLLTTGFSLLISALNVFYEDIKYLTSIILYLLFFLCPVIYFSEQVYYRHPDLYFWYHLNPVAMMVTAFRKVLLAPQAVVQGDSHFAPLPLDPLLMGILVGFSVFVLWYGYWTFNRFKWRFVEQG